MNFYLFDKVVISDGFSTHTYTREDYSSLGSYHHDNREDARFKVDFCLLRRGHIVSVCNGAKYAEDIGVLVTVLYCNEDTFLAYKRPVSTSCEDNPLLFFKRFRMTQDFNDNILFVVPVRSFIKRKYVYPVGGHYYELI